MGQFLFGGGELFCIQCVVSLGPAEEKRMLRIIDVCSRGLSSVDIRP